MKRTGVLATTTLLLGLFLGTAAGTEIKDQIFGLWKSYTTHTTFRMRTGVTAQGALGSAKVFRESRQTVFVPKHYGNIIRMDTEGNTTVVWCKDSEGRWRNALLQGADRQLFLVLSQESKLTSEKRRAR